MLIGERIKKLRNSNNYTVDDLAYLLNVSKSTISKYENGKCKPNYTKLVKLSNIFNVDYKYLIGVSDFVVSEDSQFGINCNTNELKCFLKLRKYPKLYNLIMKDPERFFERANERYCK